MINSSHRRIHISRDLQLLIPLNKDTHHNQVIHHKLDILNKRRLNHSLLKVKLLQLIILLEVS